MYNLFNLLTKYGVLFLLCKLLYKSNPIISLILCFLTGYTFESYKAILFIGLYFMILCNALSAVAK